MRRTPPAADAARWRLRDAELEFSRGDRRTPQVMAICNVTPDSFSDGGEHCSVDLALAFAVAAIRGGAAIIDIGGESTRPGAVPVPEATELERVLPVIEAVRDRLPNAIVTIDTVKASVARAALAAGAHAVNDVSGGRLDPAMFEVVATAGAGMIIMHSRGTVADMASYTHADYGDVTAEVGRDLLAQVALARAAGIAEACIVLDPGLGFAKRSEHSITLLHELPRLVALGYPVLVGASRKRFIGDVTGVRVPAQRAIGSAVAHALAVQRGASIVRTHDVRATCEALAVMQALTPSPH